MEYKKNIKNLNKILVFTDRNVKKKLITIVFINSIFEMIGLGVIYPILKLLDKNNIIFDEMIKESTIEINYEAFIYIIIGLIIINFIIRAVILIITTNKILELIFKLQENLSNIIFKKLLNINFDKHTNININKEISILTNEIPLICINWILPNIYILTDIITVMIIILILGLVDIELLISISIISGLIMTITLKLAQNNSRDWGKIRSSEDEKKVEYFSKGLHNIKELIIFNKLTYIYCKFKKSNNIATSAGQKQSLIQMIPKFIIELLSVVVLCIIIIFYIYKGIELEKIIPIIGVYLVTSLRIIPLINRIIQSIQMIEYGAETVDKTIKLIDDRNENKNFENICKQIQKIKFEKLEMIGVSYKRDEKQLILKEINLKIYKGDILAIIGESGSGKTTLIDIITGIINIDQGVIKINNSLNLKENINDWRNIIGYVPQTTQLLSGDIKENIAFCDEKEIDYKKLIKSMEAVNIYDIYTKRGLDIGENGIKISGGQRQRIAIARALYNNPSILILDEAFSALDNLAELEIIKRIKEEYQQITIISVTHKVIETIYNRKAKIESGIVVEL